MFDSETLNREGEGTQTAEGNRRHLLAAAPLTPAAPEHGEGRGGEGGEDVAGSRPLA